MLSWLAKQMLDRNMRAINAGDPEPTLKMDAEDVHFSFPGDSSWGGEYNGKAELRPWLQRFTEAGLEIGADEVVLKGPPWKQTLCVRGTDSLRSPEGELVYENRYVIWGHIKWGKLRDYEVYEDTQKSKALDEYLGVASAA